jgi:hypothetical protein
LTDKTLLELVELLDKQTIAHHDEDADYEESEFSTFRGNLSIRYEPATGSEISSVGQKFNTTLPDDYKSS